MSIYIDKVCNYNEDSLNRLYGNINYIGSLSQDHYYIYEFNDEMILK